MEGCPGDSKLLLKVFIEWRAAGEARVSAADTIKLTVNGDTNNGDTNNNVKLPSMIGLNTYPLMPSSDASEVLTQSLLKIQYTLSSPLPLALC